MFTSEDHEKFRTLRIAHLAVRFEELITDGANDQQRPHGTAPRHRSRNRRPGIPAGRTSIAFWRNSAPYGGHGQHPSTSTSSLGQGVNKTQGSPDRC